MRIKEIIKETTEREIQQAIYMEGQCGVLAIAIHQSNPRRYPLGYIYEYNHPGQADIHLEPDEFSELSKPEQQEIMYNHQNWGLVHAYVVDQRTQEYIDARGRHKILPSLNYKLNLTRKNVFPADPEDIIRIYTEMEWDDVAEEWKVTKGVEVWNKIGRGLAQALAYAIKHLGIEPVNNNS